MIFFRGPKKEVLNEYRLKVGFLQKVVARLESEKLEREAVVNSRKSSVSSHNGDLPDGIARKIGVITHDSGFSILPHGPASTSEPIEKEIHQKLEGRRNRNVRDQLFDGEDLYGSDFSESGKRELIDFPQKIKVKRSPFIFRRQTTSK